MATKKIQIDKVSSTGKELALPTGTLPGVLSADETFLQALENQVDLDKGLDETLKTFEEMDDPVAQLAAAKRYLRIGGGLENVTDRLSVLDGACMKAIRDHRLDRWEMKDETAIPPKADGTPSKVSDYDAKDGADEMIAHYYSRYKDAARRRTIEVAYATRCEIVPALRAALAPDGSRLIPDNALPESETDVRNPKRVRDNIRAAVLLNANWGNPLTIGENPDGTPKIITINGDSARDKQNATAYANYQMVRSYKRAMDIRRKNALARSKDGSLKDDWSPKPALGDMDDARMETLEAHKLPSGKRIAQGGTTKASETTVTVTAKEVPLDVNQALDGVRRAYIRFSDFFNKMNRDNETARKAGDTWSDFYDLELLPSVKSDDPEKIGPRELLANLSKGLSDDLLVLIKSLDYWPGSIVRQDQDADTVSRIRVDRDGKVIEVLGTRPRHLPAQPDKSKPKIKGNQPQPQA